MNSKSNLFFPLILFLVSHFLFICCHSKDAIDEKNGYVNFENVNYQKLPEGNLEMAKIHHHNFSNAIPDGYYFLNSLRAKAYSEMEGSVRGEQKIQFLFNFANELLLAGNMVECREKLSQLLEAMNFDENDIHKENAQVHILKGLSFIYQAIQEDNNGDFPNFFQVGSAFKITDSSKISLQKAQDTFEHLAKTFPEEKYYQWINHLLVSWLSGNFQNPLNQQIGNKDLKFRQIGKQQGILHEAMVGGLCVADFNNDGAYDIVCGSIGLNDALFYYEGDETGNFKLKSKEASLEGLIGGLSIIQGDYNNDGFTDIYIVRGGTLPSTGKQPNSLLKNNGDGTFTDVTGLAGLLDYHPGNHAHFVDYNNDGFLDIFVSNESITNYFRNANPCQLFHNNGDGTFTEVASKSGLDISKMVQGSAWLDVNNDGWLDVYLSIEGDSNRLYLNKGPQLDGNNQRFEQIQHAGGAFLPIQSGFSVAKDIDQDGFEDLLVFGKTPEEGRSFFVNPFFDDPALKSRPRLFLNQGNGYFQEASESWMIDYNLLTLGGASGDFDNNGFPDFYIGSGNSNIETMVPNLILHNSGEALTVDATPQGTAFLGKTNSVQLVDINLDGKVDILASMGGFYEFERRPPALWINESEKTGTWIQVKLEGEKANRQGIGSLIQVTTHDDSGNEKKWFQRISTNQSPSVAHFGLGEAQKITEITVQWGAVTEKVQIINNPQLNQQIIIRQE